MSNTTQTPTPSPMWALLLQSFIPLGVEAIESVIALIQKEARGEPITAADWRQLAILHASKTAEQRARDLVAKMPLASGLTPP